MNLASVVYACLYFDSKVVWRQLHMEQHAGEMAIQTPVATTLTAVGSTGIVGRWSCVKSG